MGISNKVWKSNNNRIDMSIRFICLFFLCYSCNSFCNDVPDRLKRELIKEKRLYEYCISYKRIIEQRDTFQLDIFLSYGFCDKTVSAIHAEMVINTLNCMGEDSFLRSYDRLSLSRKNNLIDVFRCYKDELRFSQDSISIPFLRKKYPLFSEMLEL